MSKPGIDVVIPLYNQGKYLNECVMSVLYASSQDANRTVHITIVNDCSTDDSDKIAGILQKKWPDKITLKNHVINKGVSCARNSGTRNTHNPYLLFLDADDAIPINYLKELSNILDTRADIDIVYTDMVLGKDLRAGTATGYFRAQPYLELQFRFRNFINVSALHRRKVFNDIKGFDEQAPHMYEDYDYWIRAIKQGFNPIYTTRAVLLYRQHDHSAHNRTKAWVGTDYLRNKHRGWYKG